MEESKKEVMGFNEIIDLLEEERPYFVSVIPAIINMTEYILLEKEKDEQKLKTILAQQVPIYQGELVFDPEEAKVMHKGSCQMMKNLKVIIES